MAEPSPLPLRVVNALQELTAVPAVAPGIHAPRPALAVCFRIGGNTTNEVLSSMRYQYVFVAEIRGLIPPKGTEIVIDAPIIGGSVTYTDDRNSIPEVVDLKSTVGGQLLGTLGGKSIGDREAELRHGVQLIRQKRQASNSHDALAIVRATGETEDFALEQIREDEKFIVFLGDSPAKDIQKSHKSYVQSLLAALLLASPGDTSARTLIDCVLFYRNDGKPIFCYEMEAYATAYTALPITQNLADEAALLTSRLLKGRPYSDVIRLLTKSMDLANDQLLSFLSAWTALEIFISKIFKEYESLMFNNAGSGSISAHPEVIKRMREVMSDKFRLTDKFAIIAGVLGKGDVDADLKTFADLKGVRDKLFHGKEIQIRSLPCETTRNLVSKYFKLHLTLGDEALGNLS